MFLVDWLDLVVRMWEIGFGIVFVKVISLEVRSGGLGSVVCIGGSVGFRDVFFFFRVRKGDCLSFF